MLFEEIKDSYRRNMQLKLQRNSIREVWEGVKTIICHKTKTRAVGGTMERVNKMNNCFN